MTALDSSKMVGNRASAVVSPRADVVAGLFETQASYGMQRRPDARQSETTTHRGVRTRG